MDRNDWRGSATLAFLVDALGRGVTAVPFDAPSTRQADRRARNERHERRVNGAVSLQGEEEETATPIPGAD